MLIDSYLNPSKAQVGMPGIPDRLKILTGSPRLSLSYPHVVLAVQQSAHNDGVYVLVAKLGNASEPQEVTEFVTYRVLKQSECTYGSYFLVRDGAAIFKAIDDFRTRLNRS
jgi:hypothetical protein